MKYLLFKYILESVKLMYQELKEKIIELAKLKDRTYLYGLCNYTSEIEEALESKAITQAEFNILKDLFDKAIDPMIEE